MADNFFFPMDKGFIDRIHKIIITNIANENFGVGDLASLIGLSTSQTLRKVRAITGKSVNHYISEVRLTEAAKLIEETDLTAAEIAYKVGFGSPSYFNKTFRRHYGLTPGDYKTKNERLQKLALKKLQKGTSHIISNRNILYLITIAMLFMVGYLIISNASSSKIKHEKTSIAVMPFKALGKKSDSLSVAEALTELVLDHLSKVNALIVISKNASEQFKDSIMSSSTIGELLNANYIVNASVQYYGDSIRVIARIDDTETDEQIWSQIYHRKVKNLFAMQSEISKHIVSQLNITISPQELKMLETPMTNNIQAYEYYIKGKALADERSYSGLTNSIELFKRAIVLDSEFGHAYAEIANSYSQLNIHAISSDSIKKVNLINIENY